MRDDLEIERFLCDR